MLLLDLKDRYFDDDSFVSFVWLFACFVVVVVDVVGLWFTFRFCSALQRHVQHL